MIERMFFVFTIFSIIAFLIFYAREHFILPDLLERQRDDLMQIAGVINGTFNYSENIEG